MVTSPLCWFNRHDPDLDLVRRDMLDFVGHCRHCGAPIRRNAQRVWTRRPAAEQGAHPGQSLGRFARSAGERNEHVF